MKDFSRGKISKFSSSSSLMDCYIAIMPHASQQLTQSLTISREMVQYYTIRRIFNFTHPKYLLRASVICDLYAHHIWLKMAKFEGSRCFTSKDIAFFWKVPIAIFVNPGQCPCKSVKTKSCITSSKINISKQNFDGKCFLKW